MACPCCSNCSPGSPPPSAPAPATRKRSGWPFRTPSPSWRTPSTPWWLSSPGRSPNGAWARPRCSSSTVRTGYGAMRPRPSSSMTSTSCGWYAQLHLLRPHHHPHRRNKPGGPELRRHLQAPCGQAPGQGRGGVLRGGPGCLREFLLKRLPRACFDSEATLDPPGPLLRRPSTRPALARELLPAGDRRRTHRRARGQGPRSTACPPTTAGWWSPRTMGCWPGSTRPLPIGVVAAQGSGDPFRAGGPRPLGLGAPRCWTSPWRHPNAWGSTTIPSRSWGKTPSGSGPAGRTCGPGPNLGTRTGHSRWKRRASTSVSARGIRPSRRRSKAFHLLCRRRPAQRCGHPGPDR